MTTPRPLRPPKTLIDYAVRIRAHLERFERDPKVNAVNKATNLHPYYHANAWSNGRRVCVRYVVFQHESSLTKEEAAAYLARLDAGEVVKHFAAPIAATIAKRAKRRAKR